MSAAVAAPTGAAPTGAAQTTEPLPDVLSGPKSPISFPDRANFAVMGQAYLNSGSTHPFSLGARDAVTQYLQHRTLASQYADFDTSDERVLGLFAELINANVDEVTFVQSTTMGENMVVRGLGLPKPGAHVVTDTLHFFGSLPLYEHLQDKGCDVTFVKARDGRIDLDDMKAAITPGTKLVAISAVSTINGFAHDVKAVCDLAHAQGALVYVDMVHAAGCIPVDVKAWGVDFAACASYKWLMGDFGMGFIYARKDVQHLIDSVFVGYEGISKFQSHIYPFDPPGDRIVDWGVSDDATGRFAVGTHSFSLLAHLEYSLNYIKKAGLPRIQAHAQTMAERLKKELPTMGYSLMTPLESRTPMVACALENARDLAPKFKAANVNITLSTNRLRLSMSVFNDMDDIERALKVLSQKS